MKIFYVFFLLFVSFKATSNECDNWFRESKIQPGGGCIEKCLALPTDMATFNCNLECKHFCGRGLNLRNNLGDILYYPGLTRAERKLVSQFPKEALLVYKAKWDAEQATMKRFRRDTEGDESDAFRHFVWAAHLSKALGREMAKKFLDAHEADGGRDPSGRAMDLANNRAGLLAAEKLRKKGKLNAKAIEIEALAALKVGSLVILRPKEGPR